MIDVLKIPGRMRRSVRSSVRAIFGIDLVPAPSAWPTIRRHTVTPHIEVLLDSAFHASVNEVILHTSLDTARLANLWQLCRMSNPAGSIIEVGTHRGGSALHLSNSSPKRRIYVCDTFEGFGDVPIDPQLDHLFHRGDFSDASFDAVKALWRDKGRDVVWVKGYFPASASDLNIEGISFAHLDVDLYQSTADTLEFLRPRFLDRSIIVIDDYLKNTPGLMKAVREFEAAHPEWCSFPMYPGEGIMIHRSWFESSR
jgi:O-methyltransferase